MSTSEFRAETRDWLEENCPPGARGEGQIPTGSTRIEITDPDVRLWLERMAEKGWTVPTWPAEYGGAGLREDEFIILVDEMRRIEARSPLMGMGTGLIGPTLLELGTDGQKIWTSGLSSRTRCSVSSARTRTFPSMKASASSC